VEKAVFPYLGEIRKGGSLISGEIGKRVNTAETKGVASLGLAACWAPPPPS